MQTEKDICHRTSTREIEFILDRNDFISERDLTGLENRLIIPGGENGGQGGGNNGDANFNTDTAK